MQFRLFLVLFFLLNFSIFSQDIFTAVSEGNLEQVKAFVETLGTDVNLADSKGRSLLYFAPLKIKKYLLEKGAIIDDKSLKRAIENHYYLDLQLYIDHGLNIYRLLTDGGYKDNSFAAELRRYNKTLAALELNQYMNYDYQKNDPDFATSSTKLNIIDYVLKYISTGDDNLHSLTTLNILVRKNLTLQKQIIPLSKNSIYYHCMTDNVEAVKEFIKNGNSLKAEHFHSIGFSNSDKILNFLDTLGLLNEQNRILVYYGAVCAGNVTFIKTLSEKYNITIEREAYLWGRRSYLPLAIAISLKNYDVFKIITHANELQSTAIDFKTYAATDNLTAMGKIIEDIENKTYPFTVTDLLNCSISDFLNFYHTINNDEYFNAPFEVKLYFNLIMTSSDEITKYILNLMPNEYLEYEANEPSYQYSKSSSKIYITPKVTSNEERKSFEMYLNTFNKKKLLITEHNSLVRKEKERIAKENAEKEQQEKDNALIILYNDISSYSHEVAVDKKGARLKPGIFVPSDKIIDNIKPSYIELYDKYVVGNQYVAEELFKKLTDNEEFDAIIILLSMKTKRHNHFYTEKYISNQSILDIAKKKRLNNIIKVLKEMGIK